MTPDQELAYVAAFIDGEGWVLCKRCCGGKKIQRNIGFTNTDKELFDSVVGMLQRAGFDIHCARRDSGNPLHAPRWNARVRGGKEAFRKFAELVPLQHSGKKARLAAILAGYLTTDEAGRKRALSRSESLTPERRKEISALALAARWKKAA